MDESVAVGGDAEEAAKEEWGVVCGLAVADAAVGGVEDTVDEGARLVGETGGVALHVVVIVSGFSGGAYFVLQARAIDVAGGDAVLGAGEDLGEGTGGID